MDALIADFVRETTATTGTVEDVSLVAETGYARFSDAYSVDGVTYYVIRDGNNAELGIGTVKTGNVLGRTTPLVTLVGGTYDTDSPSRINLSGDAIVAVGPSAKALIDASNEKVIESLAVPASAETGDLAVATAVVGFHVAYAFSLSEVFAGVNVAPTGAAIEINIKKNGTTIFSTNLTIGATHTTSLTASTAAVLTSTPLSFAKGDYVTIDVVQVGATEPGEGLKVYMLGKQL